MKCDQASVLESDSYDRKLVWHEKLALKGHLLVCTVCRKLHKQLRFLDQTHHHLCEKHSDLAGCHLSQDAEERIRQAIQEESANG